MFRQYFKRLCNESNEKKAGLKEINHDKKSRQIHLFLASFRKLLLKSRQGHA